MKNKTLSLLGLLLSISAFASPITVDVISAPQGLTIQNENAVETLPTNYVTEQILTQGNAVGVTNKSFEQSSNIAKQAYALYDFSVSGGATGGYNLGMNLPNKAVITKVWFDVITQPTGTGAFLNLAANSSANLQPSWPVASYTVGQWIGTPTGTTATTLKLAAATGVTLNVTGAALTAGKIAFFIDYLISN